MPQVERKHATILAADVFGFSAMMGRDEPGTLERLKASRAVIEQAIAAHAGRVFGTAGDSLIAEFADPVAAVHCAAEFQGSLAARNHAAPEPERMWFRVGINAGDVLVDADNLYGDGVNIAARLEQQAPPGGISISQGVHAAAQGDLPVPFTPTGDRALKNIATPVRAYHWAPDGAPPPAQTTAAAGPTLFIRPFTVAGDADTQFLADGLRENLITSLGRFTALDVIHDPDGNPAFTLTATVRGHGGRLRLTFGLIETATDRQLWTDRFDRQADDLFALEEEIARAVTAAVRVKLKDLEYHRLRDALDDDLSTQELLDKAAAIFVHGPGDNARAEAAVRSAIARERDNPPQDNSMAHAMLFTALIRPAEYTPLALPAAIIDALAASVDHALALAPDSYFAHLVAAIAAEDVLLDFPRAQRHAQAALTINPDFQIAITMAAIARSHLGDPRGAIADLQHALDAGRADPNRFRIQRELALAQFMAGDAAAAAATITQLVQTDPQQARNKLIQAALLHIAGDTAAAQATARELQAEFPELTSATARPTPIGNANNAQTFAAALAAIL